MIFRDFRLWGFGVMVFGLCVSRLELTLDPELALGKVGIWKRSWEKYITRCGDVQPAFQGSGLPGFCLGWYAGCLALPHTMEGVVLAFIHCCITATEISLYRINPTGFSAQLTWWRRPHLGSESQQTVMDASFQRLLACGARQYNRERQQLLTSVFVCENSILTVAAAFSLFWVSAFLSLSSS